MTRALAVTTLLLALAGVAAQAADAPSPCRDRLTALVARLSDPALGGRATASERERSAALLAAEMRGAGLLVAPGRRDFALDVKARVGVPAGRHLLGWRPGREEGRWVLVVARYDGRARAGDLVVPGADGNASGVAAMIEAARALSVGPAPRHGVLFAALDLSEHGREGSRYLAEQPPLDLARCAAVVDVEHLGRSFGDAMPGALFVFGASAGGVRRTAAALAPVPGAVVRALGIDLCPLAETDALAFEAKGLPTAVVTAGPSRDDGTPQDLAEKIDTVALEARTRVLAEFVRALAEAPARAEPFPTEDPGADLAVLRDVLEDVAARAETLGLSDVAQRRSRLAADLVAGLAAKESVTPGDRTAARIFALDVLGRLTEPR